MLQVAIHHRQVGSTGGEHAFDAGTGQTVPADAAQAANVRARDGRIPHCVRHAIGGIVVDEDHFPADRLKRLLQQAEHRLDTRAFIQCRDDDSQIALQT